MVPDQDLNPRPVNSKSDASSATMLPNRCSVPDITESQPITLQEWMMPFVFTGLYLDFCLQPLVYSTV